MAIEFDCPYCTATIRVPDAFGGKQGRCPKCDTHLLVPMVVRPGSQTVPETATAPGGVISDVTSDTNSQTEELFFNPISPANSSIRRRRMRRRPSRALVIGMPVICFLVLVAIIAYSLTGTLPLTGEFTARPLAERSLPRVTIPWSDTGLSSEDQKVLQEFLRTTPETLISQIMTCRLIGEDDGIQVQLTADEENSWYAVNPKPNPALALWLKKERSALDLRRVAALKTRLVLYCRDKLAQFSGETIEVDLVAIRDEVAINASCGPFGSVILAKTGRKEVLCAYEDEQGTIYFCLPKGTQSFQIIGRTFPDKSKPFAGEYNVVVSRDPSPTPATPAVDKSDNEPEKSVEAQSLPDPDSAGDGESKTEEMKPEMDGETEMKPE